MTGMGLARFLESRRLKTERFIDSDPAFKEKKINEVPIVLPTTLPELRQQFPNMVIIVAVSIKESEIVSMLQEMEFVENDYILYSRFCDNFYTIDVVGTCNLKCPSCAHGVIGMQSPRGLMSLENFKLVVDKIVSETELVSHLSLYSWGEPLLHPDLHKMVEYVHGYGIAAAVSSNLSIRFDERLKNLIKASPEYLKVSLSGFYASAYNETHKGGDINLVKSNLYRIKYYMERFKASTLVDVNYHLYTNNSGKNLRKMQELCDELGFSLSTTYALVMPLERVLGYCDGNPDEDLAGLRKILLVDIDEGIEAAKAFRTDECPFQENQVNINWDLTVPVCCTTFERNNTVVAENYLHSSLEQINSQKKNMNICEKCMDYGLPAYNMGFNRTAWDVFASEKEILD